MVWAGGYWGSRMDGCEVGRFGMDDLWVGRVGGLTFICSWSCLFHRYRSEHPTSTQTWGLYSGTEFSGWVEVDMVLITTGGVGQVDGRGWKGEYSITHFHVFLELSFPEISLRAPDLLTNMGFIFRDTVQ